MTYAKGYADFRKDIAECCVLLKGDKSFTVNTPGTVALFGSGVRHTVGGGTGSGEVNSKECATIEESFEAAGFTITTKAWLDAYDVRRAQARKDFIRDLKREAKAAHTNAIIYGMGAVMPEPEYSLPLFCESGEPCGSYETCGSADSCEPRRPSEPCGSYETCGSADSCESRRPCESCGSADSCEPRRPCESRRFCEPYEEELAVYVLSRISGEGNDRKPIKGDVLLADSEVRDILALNAMYKKFLLALNVGAPVDLSPVMDVRNIVLLSQLGCETGSTLVDLCLGKTYPSGKLACTWSAWTDYQTIGDFGDPDDTYYREGIYVGYRYFDTVGVCPLFPFGFGLSYTTFDIAPKDPVLEGSNLYLPVVVTNTGSEPGKEVVELYVSIPSEKPERSERELSELKRDARGACERERGGLDQNESGYCGLDFHELDFGELDQPYQVLAAFAKTPELAAGMYATLTLVFDMRDIASYSTQAEAYVLERGDYLLRVGNSSAQTRICGVITLNDRAVVVKTKNCLGNPGFEDAKLGWSTNAMKLQAAADAPAEPPHLLMDASQVRTVVATYDVHEEPDDLALASSVAATLSDEELVSLSIGAFDEHAGIANLIGNASRSVAGAAGETSSVATDRGILPLVMADGPAGLRLAKDYVIDASGKKVALGNPLIDGLSDFLNPPAAFLMKKLTGSSAKPNKKQEVLHQYCSTIPIGSAIAQTWNVDYARSCADMVGSEMERFGVHVWLAPGMNIQRSILCGRNFEYFSEDPLLTGTIAAAMTRGVQQHAGCGVTIKHYAANNQETNRYASNSHVSERAMREIYLKAFEICIKCAAPHALMTSYNLLNGVHTSAHRGLITNIVREEFRFDGVVMTDWMVAGMVSRKAKHRQAEAHQIVGSGCDLIMPGSKADKKSLIAALKTGTISRDILVEHVNRIARLSRLLHASTHTR